MYVYIIVCILFKSETKFYFIKFYLVKLRIYLST